MAASKQGGLYKIPDHEATANRLYGAVDLGSNTFRLLIGKVKNGRCKSVIKKMHTVRLAEGIQDTGCINEQAFKRAKTALADFKNILDQHQPKTVRACGTAALRIATNREEFITMATATLGIKPEIINGEEEAWLSSIGALATTKKTLPTKLLLIDVGGSSSELTVATKVENGYEIKKTTSLQAGAVSASELTRNIAPPTEKELANMAAQIEQITTPALAEIESAPETIIGIGGTATALAALACNLDKYDGERIQDHQLSLSELDKLLTRLSSLSARERNQLPGLNNGRGEIIIGGLMIFITILKTLPHSRLTISDGGLQEGILLSIITNE